MHPLVLIIAIDLFIAILILGVGTFILFRDQKNRLHQVFALMSYGLSGWLISVLLADSSTSLATALFWTRSALIGPLLFGPLFFYLTLLFPKGVIHIKQYVPLIFFLPALLFVPFLFTNYNASEVSFETWGTNFKSGILYSFLFIYLLAFIGGGFFNLIRGYRRYPIFRNQINYIFIATYVLTGVGILTNLILPTFFSIGYLSSIGPSIALFLFSSIIAYAVFAHHLFDITIIVRLGTIFAISFLGVAGLFVFSTTLLARILPDPWPLLFSSFAITVLFAPIKKFAENLTDKIFFQKKYKFTELINTLADILREKRLNLHLIIKEFDALIKQALRVSDTSFVIMPGKFYHVLRKAIIKNEVSFLVLNETNPLTQYFHDDTRALYDEEIQKKIFEEKSESEKIKQKTLFTELKQLGASVVLPLSIGNEVVMLYVLGKKKSRDQFYAHDFELLEHALHELGIVIENVISYEQIKMSKEEIMKEKAQDEALLASIGNGVIATDKHGNIMFINPEAERLLGRTNKELNGKNWFDIALIKNDYGATVTKNNQPLYNALSSGKTVVNNILNYQCRDGHVFPASITSSPIMLRGNVIGAIEIFRDITEEKEIDRAKSEFVSIASHQLRTPLSTMRWYLEMLLAERDGVTNKKQKRYLEEIYHGNQRLIALVNALLHTTRIELGAVTIQKQPTNISDIAEGALQEFALTLRQKKLKLIKNFDANLPLINLDPMLTKTVLQNLIANAVTYTPKNGSITVTIEKQKSDIVIKVADTGFGIPKDAQAKIFTKFFRGENIKDKSTDGTGLGLYIVKSIVEKSGGKIWFESEENKGTSFYISIPLLEKSVPHTH